LKFESRLSRILNFRCGFDASTKVKNLPEALGRRSTAAAAAAAVQDWTLLPVL